jgi:hypothetical protein
MKPGILALRVSSVMLLSAIGLLLFGVTLTGASPVRPIYTRPLVDVADPNVSHFPNCRYGIGQSSQSNYAVTALNLGWYLDWRTSITPTRPNEAEYMQVVRIQPATDGSFTFTPPTATLQAAVLANLGAVWLIGNEPDSPLQDNVVPELYARAYHHLYGLIKSYDPTARIGAGGIVQPTPLRFQYLDRVLATYRSYYSQTLPADLWNTHSYILREITYDDPEACASIDPDTHQCTPGPLEVWGAYVPPGINATRGELYTYSQMFSLSIFRQRLIDFRQWLSRHGYRDMPLLITEYGTLFPYPPYIDGDPYVDENGVPMTEARTATFMTGSFDVLRTLVDPNIGYRADGGRLVQRWSWYSADDVGYGGVLFYTDTHALNPLGQVFAAYSNQQLPAIDLNVATDSSAAPWAGQPITFILKATVGNQGNISVSAPFTVTFYDGLPGSGVPIGWTQIPGGLSGCGGAVAISTTWTVAAPGLHTFYVEVDSTHSITETDDNNNIATGWALASTQHVYLPMLLR